MNTLNTRRYPFYISIATLVVSIVIVLTGLFLWISHRESSTVALNLADRFFDELNEKASERYQNALESVSILAGSAVIMAGMDERPAGDGLLHPGLGFMIKALNQFEHIFSLYTGYGDGSFLMVTASRGIMSINNRYSSPEGTWFIIRAISTDEFGITSQLWTYLDKNAQTISARIEDDPPYDPRKRPWYLKALESERPVYTAPYVFDASKLPGITCAKRLTGNDGVFGADITLEQFAHSLVKQRVSQNGLLFFFDQNGRIMVHPDENTIRSTVTKKGGVSIEEIRFVTGDEIRDPIVKAVVASHAASDGIAIDKTEILEIENKPFLVRLSTMDEKLGFDEIIGSAAPLADFTGHISHMHFRITMFSLLMLAIVLPLALLVTHRFSGSLRRLEKEANRIQQFDFSETPPLDSAIKELHSLIQAFILMKSTIRQRTGALIATQNKLEKLVKSGIALSAEQDMAKLLEQIFISARELSRAETGSFYLRGKDDMLRFQVMQTATDSTDEPGREAASEPIPLYDPETGEENHLSAATHAVLSGKTVFVDDINGEHGFDMTDTLRQDKGTGDALTSFIGVPLKTRQGKIVGVLQLFNARMEETEAIIPFEGENVGFVEALAAQAAISLNNQQLLDDQRNLFNALIEMLAGAIDAKSPYTGGHCARVPELALLLADAAHRSSDDPFTAFELDSEDKWREFRVAAWLHDCGKVTTPEFVVDKATKLETIYNRIHEIRTRFEVLWRDAEINYLKKHLEGSKETHALKEALEKERAWIRDAYAFVAECNIGGEFMADEKISRLEEIAARKWERHLDDRLGLSQEETDRQSQEAVQSLPAVESLLADKPAHITPRLKGDPFDGNPYDFKMDVPEHLYNHGELYNLCIRKGTLTTEERFKINEHITQTIIMLNKLPFPAYLTQIPEFAGAHHETMIGTGYPRQLHRDDMSIPARIMAIADIFEALTAADRPYKKAKNLSDALRIMSFMRDDRHLDPKLFNLFLTSGVYLAYAEKFLDPSQIDPVDIHDYMGAV